MIIFNTLSVECVKDFVLIMINIGNIYVKLVMLKQIDTEPECDYKP